MALPNRVVLALELIALAPVTVVCAVFLFWSLLGIGDATSMLSSVLFFVVMVAHVSILDMGRRVVSNGLEAIEPFNSGRWIIAITGAFAIGALLLIAGLTSSPADARWRWTSGFDIFLVSAAYLIPLTHMLLLATLRSNNRWRGP